jgi:hypothetical protein
MHTHTHTHTHTYIHTYIHSLSLSPPLSHSLSYTHTHTHTHTRQGLDTGTAWPRSVEQGGGAIVQAHRQHIAEGHVGVTPPQ